MQSPALLKVSKGRVSEGNRSSIAELIQVVVVAIVVNRHSRSGVDTRIAADGIQSKHGDHPRDGECSRKPPTCQRDAVDNGAPQNQDIKICGAVQTEIQLGPLSNP